MKTIAILAAMACMAALVWAADTDTPLVIRRVALFKNGLGYFVSDTTLPGTPTVNFGQIPVPSLGTFWLGYPSNTPVRALVTGMEEVTKTNVARSMAEIMAANIGRKASLGVAGAPTSMVEGVILDVPREAAPRATPSPYVMDTRMPRNNENYYNSGGAGGQLAVIKTFNGVAVVNIGTITRLDLPGGDVTTTVAVTMKRPSLRLELDRPAPGTKVSVSYLARGITWFPSYLIDLSHSSTARLSAKAMVINEVADLTDVQVELVTGFPNIQLSDISSPIAMSEPLADFLTALTMGRSGWRSSDYGDHTRQVIIDNRYSEPGYDRDGSSPQPSYSTAQEGRATEDLFLYPAGTINLKRGETACIPLFTAELPYTHLYTWRIPDFINEEARWADSNERDSKPREEEVWHCCRIKNTTTMPWTTAPAEFIKDGQFTGQDTCYYTASGSEATIRINRAMNVLADQAEYEVQRTRSATNFYGYVYDRVEVKGELKLCNKLATAVTIEITKDVSGTVLESSPIAKDVTTAKGLKRVNPSHILTWSRVVEPGKEDSLSYTYEVFIRN